MKDVFWGGKRTVLVCMLMSSVILAFFANDAFAVLCSQDPTSVTFDVASKDVIPGSSVDYTITIDSPQDNCEMDLIISNDKAGFTTTPANGATVMVSSPAVTTLTLTVAADKTVKIGTENTTNLIINGDANTADVLVQLTTAANNPLLHNSYNLDSTKWQSDGGWGISTGKYGEFSCKTCHAKNTGNIKRVVSNLPNAPDDSKGDFTAAGGTITFLNTSGDNSFGDDTSAHPTSTKICEICHTYDDTAPYNGVKFHAYNMPVASSHENKNDCINCHQHKTGFRASCTSCHGDGNGTQIWPDGVDNNGNWVDYADDQAGAHDNHVLVISQELFDMDLNALLNDGATTDKQIEICAFCHPDPGGGGHDSNGGSDDLVDMQPAGKFQMFMVGDGVYGDDPDSTDYDYTEDSCDNLVCHNQMATPDVSTDSQGWNNPPGSIDCRLCHDTNGGSERHDTHVGDAKFACTQCHSDNGTFNTATLGADHPNGDVDLVWSNGSSYEATYGDSSVIYNASIAYKDTPWGTCASAACHSNSLTPRWNEYGTGCGLCHNDTMTKGAHSAHTDIDGDESYGEHGSAFNDTTSTAYDFGCGECHARSATYHVNGTVDVETNSATLGWNGTAQTCDNAYCHSGLDVSNNRDYAVSPKWNTGTISGDCNDCHGNSPESGAHHEHQVGFHYDSIYSGKLNFLPVTDTDPIPANLVNSASIGRDALRGHGGRLESDGSPNSTTMSCHVCHNATVTTSVNDQNSTCAACHDDSVTAKLGDVEIADKTVHANGTVDVVFIKEKIRSKAQVRDDLYDVPELGGINWERFNGYKRNNGSSYDESKDTLYNMAALHGGYDAGDPGTLADNTCQISCHLWEANRVDKYPAEWYGGAIICIDCHTRLPK